MITLRTPYPTDVSDEEWAFVAAYLTLLSEDAAQRPSSLREVFNAFDRTRGRCLAHDAQ